MNLLIENKNMKYSNSSLIHEKKSPLNHNLISKLFFQFNEINGRGIKLDKVNEMMIENENNFLSNSRRRNNNNCRDNLLTEIEYIYKETNKPNENHNLKNIIADKKIEYSKNINESIFPIQLKNNSIIIPKMKKRKKKYNSNLENCLTDEMEFNDESMHKIIHNQIIPLKGKENKTYKLKYKKIPKKYDFINIFPNQMHVNKDQYLKSFDDYEMRFNALNMRKDAFKV